MSLMIKLQKTHLILKNKYLQATCVFWKDISFILKHLLSIISLILFSLTLNLDAPTRQPHQTRVTAAAIVIVVGTAVFTSLLELKELGMVQDQDPGSGGGLCCEHRCRHSDLHGGLFSAGLWRLKLKSAAVEKKGDLIALRSG